MSSNEFRVLCYLLSFSEGRCYPSYGAIGEATGLRTRAAVNRCLRELKRLGIISWRRGGPGASNLYKVNPEADWDLSSRNRFKGGKSGPGCEEATEGREPEGVA